MTKGSSLETLKIVLATITQASLKVQEKVMIYWWLGRTVPDEGEISKKVSENSKERGIFL